MRQPGPWEHSSCVSTSSVRTWAHRQPRPGIGYRDASSRSVVGIMFRFRGRSAPLGRRNNLHRSDLCIEYTVIMSFSDTHRIIRELNFEKTLNLYLFSVPDRPYSDGCSASGFHRSHG